MVIPAGFEPSVTAVKGRRPRPASRRDQIRQVVIAFSADALTWWNLPYYWAFDLTVLSIFMSSTLHYQPRPYVFHVQDRGGLAPQHFRSALKCSQFVYRPTTLRPVANLIKILITAN